MWIQHLLTSHPVRVVILLVKADSRTVGCCAHVAVVVWYLCNACHADFTFSAGRRKIEQTIAEVEMSSDED